MPNVIVVRNTYPDAASLKRVLDYVLRTPLCGGYGVDPCHAFDQMMLVKKAFHQTDGVQLKHFFITFTIEESYGLDFNDILSLGFQIGGIFHEYQVVYCIHLDSSHIHFHFVMNTVSFLDGHKYSNGLAVFKRICTFLKGQFTESQVHLCLTELYSPDHAYTYEKKEQYLMLD